MHFSRVFRQDLFGLLFKFSPEFFDQFSFFFTDVGTLRKIQWGTKIPIVSQLPHAPSKILDISSCTSPIFTEEQLGCHMSSHRNKDICNKGPQGEGINIII